MRVLVVFVLMLLLAVPVYAAPEKPDILEIVNVSFIGESAAASFEELLEKIEQNPKVKAILLLVDSPGGGVIATKTMYDALSRLKIPVAAWCNTECASGGYFLLMAPTVKWIGMRDVTITGSIGVIMHMLRFNRLLNWAQIDAETYRSGYLKDAGNSFRAAEEAERVYLQGLVDQLARDFFDTVRNGRPQMAQVVRDELFSSARIVFGSEAVRLNMADALATKDEAIKKAKELSGSKLIYTRTELQRMSQEALSEPTNKRYYKSEPLSPFMESLELVQDILSGTRVQFLYLMPYKF